jgi:hypothetical protein
MRADMLHVFVAYANPLRWANRLKAHREFEAHMLASGVKLTTIECAYGERPFELADRRGVHRVRARARTMVWNKECLLNIGIRRVPDARYIATLDGDIFFRKPDWAAEAVEALQHYHVIQPWSDAYDLGPHDEHLQVHRAFLRQWFHREPVLAGGPNWWDFDGGPYRYAHSGYAWCYTRQAYEWLGGLFELAAMGAGDHHMALALVGEVAKSVPGAVSAAYRKHLDLWQARALQHLNLRYGFTWGTIEHAWHGRKKDRSYIRRWDMILKHGFDPDTDLKRNGFGVLELAGNKPELAHDLDLYFRSRNEDANTLA